MAHGLLSAGSAVAVPTAGIVSEAVGWSATEGVV